MVDRVYTSNFLKKLREGFENYVNNDLWIEDKATSDIIMVDGNAAAASYLVISKDPLVSGTVTTLKSKPKFSMPFEASFGLHMSQRTVGQEFSTEMVSNEPLIDSINDKQIASISQTTTVLTVTTSEPHNLQVGMRIGIRDCVDSRFNYPALVVATTPTATQFTCTAGPAGTIPSVTAGPFTSGYVYLRSAAGYAQNATSMIFENAVATNASFYVRSDSGDVLPSGTITGSHSASILTTASVQAINAAATYAFQPTDEYRLYQFIDGVQWSDVAVDSIGTSNSRYKRTQVVPMESEDYFIRFRATNNKSLTVPVAKIVSATKTGTTTATIVTATSHGLTTTDVVNIYGIRDFTNFPNLAVATAVASVVDATTFTIVIGGAVTATSYGGYVSRVNGGQVQQGALTMAAQSVARTSNIVTVVGSATWSGALIGDYVNIHGMRDSATGADIGLDGPYRVRDIQTTSLVLEPIGTAPTGSDITSTNCGGAVIKRTDLRISFVRILDFERQRVEIMPRPAGDASSSVPVVLTGGAISAITTLTTVTTVGSSQNPIPTIVADVASAALTTTTTTTAVTPTFGSTYQVNIPVTAVTGTSPTLDIAIEESDDSGTNWYRVYEFPRITAIGMYRSPLLKMRGNRIRYVQTVAGTSPSFTRAINRLQSNTVTSLQVQFVDRTIVPNTLNSTTPTYLVEGCNSIALSVYITAQTTAATIALQVSDDGTNWVSLLSPATINTTVGVTQTTSNIDVLQWKFARAIVSATGSGITLGYVSLKGVGN